MFYLFYVFFGLTNAHLQEFSVPVYSPPSQDEIMEKYFQSSPQQVNNSIKIVGNSVSKILAESFDAQNMTNLEEGRTNISEEMNRKYVSKGVTDVVWTGFLRNLLRSSYETTTYKYPTAVWTSEQHEKLKEQRRNQLRKMPKIFLMKPIKTSQQEKGEKTRITSKTKRGKIKWKDSHRNLNTKLAYRGKGKEQIDKFLEQSLFRYLVSSNLIENIGNVSVDTFSEVLRNVTRQKADKRQFWPYDENKELRIKFRDEVFMKKRTENATRGNLLEKQFQKRLERMKDYINGKKKEKTWSTRKVTELVGGKIKELKSTTENVLESTMSLVDTTMPTENNTEMTMMDHQLTNISSTRSSERDVTANGEREKPDFEELKLSVAETVYYKKRYSPYRTFSYQEEETGVIPGVPEIDYPMYSSPPSTGFRCPKEIGEQPRMMADPKTRCQVFYVCTGDGPAAAMLCPNGTMFNENVRVCDWWYNVDC